jgi:hypothetical protein
VPHRPGNLVLVAEIDDHSMATFFFSRLVDTPHYDAYRASRKCKEMVDRMAPRQKNVSNHWPRGPRSASLATPGIPV